VKGLSVPCQVHELQIAVCAIVNIYGYEHSLYLLLILTCWLLLKL